MSTARASKAGIPHIYRARSTSRVGNLFQTLFCPARLEDRRRAGIRAQGRVVGDSELAGMTARSAVLEVRF